MKLAIDQGTSIKKSIVGSETQNRINCLRSKQQLGNLHTTNQDTNSDIGRYKQMLWQALRCRLKKTAKRPKLGGENTVNGEVIVFSLCLRKAGQHQNTDKLRTKLIK